MRGVRDLPLEWLVEETQGARDRHGCAALNTAANALADATGCFRTLPYSTPRPRE